MAIMFRMPQKKSRMNPPRILFSVRLLTTLPAAEQLRSGTPCADRSEGLRIFRSGVWRGRRDERACWGV